MIIGVKDTHFKGNTKIKGRPKEQAAAEIMLMKAADALQEKRMLRLFFSLLDILAIASFTVAIYSFYNRLVAK